MSDTLQITPFMHVRDLAEALAFLEGMLIVRAPDNQLLVFGAAIAKREGGADTPLPI